MKEACALLMRLLRNTFSDFPILMFFVLRTYCMSIKARNLLLLLSNTFTTNCYNLYSATGLRNFTNFYNLISRAKKQITNVLHPQNVLKKLLKDVSLNRIINKRKQYLYYARIIIDACTLVNIIYAILTPKQHEYRCRAGLRCKDVHYWDEHPFLRVPCLAPCTVPYRPTLQKDST